MSKLSDPVRFSHLKQFQLSAAHYKAAVEGADDDTYAKSDGRLLHLLTLGGDPYAVYEGKRLGNAWKDFVAARAEEGITEDNIFTSSELARVLPAANKLKSHRLVVEHDLLAGEREKRVEWKFMGRTCSSRFDVVNRERRRIVDVKKSATAEPRRFAFASRRYSYQAQGAFYADAAAYVGIEVDDVFLIAVEPAPPYAVTVFRLKPRLIDQGRAIVRGWFEQLLQCESANEWPEYSECIVDLDVPSEDDHDLQLNWGDDDAPAQDAAQ